MSGRTLNPSERDRVRDALRKLHAKYGTQTELARVTGFTQQHISAMLRTEEPTAPGIPIARKIAELSGLSLEALLGMESRVEREGRYPNRMLAAEVARRSGLDERAILNVMAWALKGRDPTPLSWLDDMRTEDSRLKRGVETVPASARTASVADEEITRPGAHRLPDHLKPKKAKVGKKK